MQHSLNFMKNIWSRMVLTLVSELYIADRKRGHQPTIEYVQDFKSDYQLLLNLDQYVRMWGWLSKQARTCEELTAEISKD